MQDFCCGCSYSSPVQDGWARLNPQPSASAHWEAPRLQHWVCWATPAGLGNNRGAKRISGLGSSRCLQLRPREEEGLCTPEEKDLHARVWFPLQSTDEKCGTFTPQTLLAWGHVLRGRPCSHVQESRGLDAATVGLPSQESQLTGCKPAQQLWAGAQCRTASWAEDRVSLCSERHRLPGAAPSLQLPTLPVQAQQQNARPSFPASTDKLQCLLYC